MTILSLIILFLLQVIYQVCKAFCDAERWLHPQMEKIFNLDWLNGTGKWSGKYWNLWHTFDTIRNIAEIGSMFLGILFVMIGWLEIELWVLILFCLFCYWMPVFSLVYHIRIGNDKKIEDIL